MWTPTLVWVCVIGYVKWVWLQNDCFNSVHVGFGTIVGSLSLSAALLRFTCLWFLFDNLHNYYNSAWKHGNFIGNLGSKDPDSPFGFSFRTINLYYLLVKCWIAVFFFISFLPFSLLKEVALFCRITNARLSTVQIYITCFISQGQRILCWFSPNGGPIQLQSFSNCSASLRRWGVLKIPLTSSTNMFFKIVYSYVCYHHAHI